MSVGFANSEPIDPEREPAIILMYIGVFFGSVPPSLFLKGSYIPKRIVLYVLSLTIVGLKPLYKPRTPSARTTLATP